MNLGLISLICLLAAIVIGFVKNCNVGILCTGIAAVLALVFGIKASDIIKGFSASLCIHQCRRTGRNSEPSNHPGYRNPGCGIRRHQPDYDGDHRRPGRYVRTYESADPGGSRCP